MAAIFFNENLWGISNEEDLMLRPEINPPPRDGRCNGCGRHLSELKPFGKVGNSLAGDSDDALLIKGFRFDAPRDEEVEEIMDEFFGDASSDEDYDRATNKLIEKYGQEEAERIMIYEQLSRTVSYSWECRDCFRLSTKRFLQMQRDIFRGEPK